MFDLYTDYFISSMFRKLNYRNLGKFNAVVPKERRQCRVRLPP